MLPAPNLDELVANLRARLGPDAASGRGPYILLLGEGCARAAGAPSREDLARDALVTFKYEPPEAWAGKSGEELVEQFSKHTSSLSSSQYGRMLRHLYAKVAVPSFYQDLALMIRERFFPLVVTMNFDTLLEQALGAAGVRNEQYLVTTFGRERTTSGTESLPPLTHLIKLHGDLSQDIAHLDPQEIENALSPSRNWIKAEFARRHHHGRARAGQRPARRSLARAHAAARVVVGERESARTRGPRPGRRSRRARS